jgi:hypothetical protein
MQVDKKPSAISDELFDLSKSFSNISTSAQLHGKYMMLKEMQIFLAEKETEINEQIKKAESNV